MIRPALALLFAAAAVAPMPALAQLAPAAASMDPARRALGLELARLLNPEAQTMAALDKVFAEQLPAAMLHDPAMKEMEAQYPGIVKAMTDAMKPILTRYLRTQLPMLWDEMAVIFASEMDEAELRAAIAFYRGPTGTRIIELMITDADLGPALNAMVANDFSASEQDVSGATISMAGNAIGRLTPEQHAEVMQFMRTPAGKRVAMVFPRLMKLVSDWSTKPAPEIEAELEAAVIPVAERFTGMKLK